MNVKIKEKYVALATTNSSRKKRSKRRTKKREGTEGGTRPDLHTYN
jgi:hypothetical protein